MHYLDYAATAPVLPEVREAMVPYLEDRWGNPSSIYGIARTARQAVDEARERFAGAIGSAPEEIVFTGGGTEADNLAVKGAAWAFADKGRHVLLPRIEHHAVLDSAAWLGGRGFEVEFLPVDRSGLVDPGAVASAIRADTTLVAVMLVNNEIGTINPIAEIAGVCRERSVLCFTDAVQALGKIPVDVRELGVDLAAFAAHKIGGPKGTGALYVRRGVRLEPLIHGGGQERGRRSGTENPAGIVGMSVAARLVVDDLPGEAPRWRALRDRLWSSLSGAVDGVHLNGHPDRRVPHNLNVSIEGITSEDALLMLDAAGICASSGSACQSGSVEPSYVLTGCGVPQALAQAALRFTVGRFSTDEDVDAVLDALPPIVDRLRSFTGSAGRARASR